MESQGRLEVKNLEISYEGSLNFIQNIELEFEAVFCRF